MLPTLKNAKLCVKALSSSLKIPESSARQFLAQALEYETWDGFVSQFNNKSPELLDSMLSPDLANHRLGLFSENLMNIFDLHSSTADDLAKAINPFSENKPKAYRIDKIERDIDDKSINLKDMFDMAGGDDGMLEFLHQMGDSDPELEFLKEFDDVGDFQDRMRISHPLNPGSYYDCLENITSWLLDDSCYEEEYEYLSESFHLVSPYDGVSYPVYLVSLTATPGDSNDEMFASIKNEISGYSGRSLILFRHPIHKELNGTVFSVIGCFYNGVDWSWTLLTSDDPETQSKKITPDNFDLESPVPTKSFGVTDYEGVRADIVYQSVVSGRVDAESQQIKLPSDVMTIGGTGGWQGYMF